ncbi:MAG: MmcQ/YjbR family DNA-binding protein [Candidatus Chaera renei]|uniref:MmcQ/YjbR family DNA-binding protein n=1 Tax=Candidatus Chaera renei TaxID=2506947 RepID=A0A4Q0AIV9_9BACT|nr:MAG: MmcQ/YjbR family DNA-binding protein [Candidatus Chaera renei]
MDHQTAEKYILGLPGAYLDYPFGEGVAVYKVPGKGAGQAATGKMFALIEEGSRPLRLSLKCDPRLAELLRQKYESVMPGYHLNKKHWNTVLCSGQLSDEEIFDLIRHSYGLVSGGEPAG